MIVLGNDPYGDPYCDVTTNSHAHANSTDSDLYATTYRASGSTSDR